MAQMLGFFIGIIVVSVACGISSYLIWEKHAGPNNTGKQIFFAFLSFGIGGLTGLIGGIPVLLLSWGVARMYKAKEEPTQPPALENPPEDKAG